MKTVPATGDRLSRIKRALNDLRGFRAATRAAEIHGRSAAFSRAKSAVNTIIQRYRETRPREFTRISVVDNFFFARCVNAFTRFRGVSRRVKQR